MHVGQSRAHLVNRKYVEDMEGNGINVVQMIWKNLKSQKYHKNMGSMQVTGHKIYNLFGISVGIPNMEHNKID